MLFRKNKLDKLSKNMFDRANDLHALMSCDSIIFYFMMIWSASLNVWLLKKFLLNM